MSNDTIELYRCTECGKLSVSLGWLHSHIERHLGWGPWKMLPPPLPGNADALMDKTEVIQVTDYELCSEPEHIDERSVLEYVPLVGPQPGDATADK
jgi:hypothetical protein